MKRALLLVSFVLAPALLALGAAAAPATSASPPHLHGPPLLSPGGTNGLGLPNPPLEAVPLLRTNAPGAARNSSELPKPGVYTASPYSMIVIVPSAHPDELRGHGFTPKNAPGSALPAAQMPIIKPELKLIPLHRGPGNGTGLGSPTNSPSR